jgi:hypothetical protein
VRRFRVAGASLALVIILLAIPLGDRKNIERQRKSAQRAAPQLRELVGNGGNIAVASMVRDMPELFYYSGINVRAFGEKGLPALASAPGGRWVVLSENATFPEYSSLVRDVPSAFPRGATKLNMPDARDKVYVGWYDPPAGVSRQVHYLTSAMVGGGREEE